jgi:hypothetical protein
MRRLLRAAGAVARAVVLSAAVSLVATLVAQRLGFGGSVLALVL